VSIWLDDLSRDRLISGSLAVLARDKHVSGVTTNPTIFARSIIDSNAYTGQLRDLRVRQAAPDQALRELTTSDVLPTVYDATKGVDGRVSIEVDPRFAYDRERTVGAGFASLRVRRRALECMAARRSPLATSNPAL